ncbi:response regulator transcription factor [Kitasatospora sp. NPDC094011]|uniref:response regulator transcription factor n=1 Tax=Kitasatospora sp. NPDC094011 TaxID=3364090 RepID=UPI00382C4F5E
MSVIRTFIVSDHALLSDALSALLQGQHDIVVVGRSQAAGLAGSVAAIQPDVVLLALVGGQAAALRAVRAARCASSRAAVLAVEPCRNGAARGKFLAAGAHYFLPWSAGKGALLRTVREAVPVAGPGSWYDVLTERELQVLRAAAESWTNQQIATALGITVGTVKRHLYSVFRKLQASSRLDAVVKAASAGLIDHVW